MEIVSARSDWSGDESLIVFKCGPYIGHKAVLKFDYDPGGGHVHPDANHFVIFAGGEWLIRDDGYQTKLTKQHNTLMISGRGQLGEGRNWFNGMEQLELRARPRIIRAESTPEMDQITGDATEAYPGDLGLERYIRHLLFLKPDVLIVVDNIALHDTCELELNFHTESHQMKRDNNAFLIRGEQTLLRLDPLTVEGVRTAAEVVAPGNMEHQKQQDDFLRISLKAKKAQWQNAVALSWAAGNDQPVKVTLQKDRDTWTFAAGDRAVVFNWTTGEAELLR